MKTSLCKPIKAKTLLQVTVMKMLYRMKLLREDTKSSHMQIALERLLADGLGKNISDSCKVSLMGYNTV